MDWVAPHLTGGLGNRLFQFAAAAGVAAKARRSLVFFLPRCGPTDHGPFDTIFKLFPTVPLVDAAEAWETILEPRDHMYRYERFEEPPAGPVVIHGYRQSPKYFPGQLVPDFENALGSEKALLIRSRMPKNAWFIHVRLGDYKILTHHQVKLESYYQECLSQIPAGSPVILFSDEPELCSEYFSVEAASRRLDFSVCTNKDELVNLYMMSLCKGGAITANSTFSWWGAYFAKHGAPPEFRAFYPSSWGQGMPPPVDLIPSWGTCVSVDV
jgi:hypothetical protein